MENATTTEKINVIAEAVACGRGDLFDHQAYDKVEEGILYAWDNWNEKVLSTYYKGKKPESPTYEFSKQWVQTELGAVPENWGKLITSFKGMTQ